ncbi:MAG: hypothetical protein ACLUW4_13680 [Butyribacter sp.]|uniref:hypothetical protein n=1 Tax=Butyribacter TaxID=2822463 RepID=UPI0038459DCD|nr:hypothetical protein [Clostridium sp.]MCQ5164479.1 hypothetical protein [Roseburia hominis]
MKKIKNLFFIIAFTMIFVNSTNVNAKNKITVNKTSITLTKGKSSTVKTNCTGFTITPSKKNIVKVTKNKKKFTIKALKTGKTNLKISKKKYVSKTIKVTVKNTTKPITTPAPTAKATATPTSTPELTITPSPEPTPEPKPQTKEEYNEKIKGLSSYCDENIWDYKNFHIIDEGIDINNKFIIALNLGWKMTPKYLKDNLVYHNTELNIDTKSILNNGSSKNTLGLCYGTNKIELKHNVGYNTLIHEMAHAYYYAIDSKTDFDIESETQKEYNENPKKYTEYGSENMMEFYAEKIANLAFYEQSPITNEEFFNYVIDNFVNIYQGEDGKYHIKYFAGCLNVGYVNNKAYLINGHRSRIYQNKKLVGYYDELKIYEILQQRYPEYEFIRTFEYCRW